MDALNIRAPDGRVQRIPVDSSEEFLLDLMEQIVLLRRSVRDREELRRDQTARKAVVVRADSSHPLSSPHASSACDALEEVLFKPRQSLALTSEQRNALHALVEAGGSMLLIEAESAIFGRKLTAGVRNGLRRGFRKALEDVGLRVSITATQISVEFSEKRR